MENNFFLEKWQKVVEKVHVKVPEGRGVEEPLCLCLTSLDDVSREVIGKVSESSNS